MPELTIRLNGDEVSVPATTVAELLVVRGLDPRLVAVELNGRVVPRATHDEARLSHGDAIEIVRFVQGG